jgi:hypothetical protein
MVVGWCCPGGWRTCDCNEQWSVVMSEWPPPPGTALRFDDEQFAALFNELQTRGDKTKLMQFFGS